MISTEIYMLEFPLDNVEENKIIFSLRVLTIPSTLSVCVSVCVRAFVCACVCACVHAFVCVRFGVQGVE